MSLSSGLRSPDPRPAKPARHPAAGAGLARLLVDGFGAVSQGRLVRLTVTAGALGLVAGGLVFGGGEGPRQRLYALQRMDDLLGICLTAATLAVAWLLTRRDMNDDYPLLGTSRWLPAVRYAVARAAVALLVLGSVTLVDAGLVQLDWLRIGGDRQAAQALHVLVIAANHIPLLLAGLWLGALLQPLAGPITALLLQFYATDAGLDNARVMLQRVPSPLVQRFILAEHWVVPRILVDPLNLVLLKNESELIKILPGDEGPVLWGDSVVAVSSAGDIAFFLLYAVALVGLYAVAVHHRMRWIQSRVPLRAFPARLGKD